MADPSGKAHWLVRPVSIALLGWAAGLAMLATLVLDYLAPSDSHFGLDGTFGFGAWFGFATCLAMVAIAKLLGLILKRRDDYYDR